MDVRASSLTARAQLAFSALMLTEKPSREHVSRKVSSCSINFAMVFGLFVGACNRLDHEPMEVLAQGDGIRVGTVLDGFQMGHFLVVKC